MKEIKMGENLREAIINFKLDSEFDNVSLDCPRCGAPARVTIGGANYGAEGIASWKPETKSFSCAECEYDGTIDPTITKVEKHSIFRTIYAR